MRSLSTILRSAAVALLLVEVAGAAGQSNGYSPYSVYGLGDLVPAQGTVSALMGGTGIGYNEQFSLLTSNPAGYTLIKGPCFEGSVVARYMDFSTTGSSVKNSNAEFRGFTIGVPFGKKDRWGLALGLTPFSDVAYTISSSQTVPEGSVRIDYTGTGGINKAFAGVARTLYLRTDTAGVMEQRLAIGANFNFLFGEVEQTNKAVYPIGYGYYNTQVFSALSLSAPTGDVGLQWTGQLIGRGAVTKRVEARRLRARNAADEWKSIHPDLPYTGRMEFRDPDPWSYTIGAAVQLPANFTGEQNDRVTTFVPGFSGNEVTLDTLRALEGVEGAMDVPLGIGAGFSIFNSRWLFTAEARSRDWSTMKVRLANEEVPQELRRSVEMGLGVRFRPEDEGGLLARTTYRFGLQYAQDYQVVRGTGIDRVSASLGLSLPINHKVTNNQLHLGVEMGQRGTTDNGLIRESFTNVWVGVSILPWRRERWFRPRQIQ